MSKFHLKNKLVRDLAWCLYSPNLVQESAFRGYELFSFERSSNADDLIRQIDANPHRLEEFLQSPFHLPTGKLFEKLLLFWFSNCPDWECLAHSVQLNDQNSTLGELDFVVLDKRSSRTIHLEVACKFYLSSSNKRNHSTWIGPNSKDNLQLKIDKLHKQLAMGKHRLAKEFCETRSFRIDNSYALVKGMFFHHFSELTSSVSPQHSSRDYLAGLWSRVSEFPFDPTNFVELSKDAWFSPYNSNLKSVSVELDRLEKPKLLAKIEKSEETGKDVEQFRIFVVPDHWPSTGLATS